MPEREETTAKSRRRFILIALIVGLAIVLIDIAWIQGPIQHKTSAKNEQDFDRERLARDLGMKVSAGQAVQDESAEADPEAGSARISRDEQSPLNPGLATEPDEDGGDAAAETPETPTEEPTE